MQPVCLWGYISELDRPSAKTGEPNEQHRPPRCCMPLPGCRRGRPLPRRSSRTISAGLSAPPPGSKLWVEHGFRQDRRGQAPWPRALGLRQAPTNIRASTSSRPGSPPKASTRASKRASMPILPTARRQWNWKAKVGTNGDTVLGSASIRSSGLVQGILPRAGDRRDAARRRRGHLLYVRRRERGPAFAARGHRSMPWPGSRNSPARTIGFTFAPTFVHVIEPKLGLSVQLRTRYFHSTVPGEFDYYSPRNFVQLLPVVQMRRFDTSGWMYLVAARLWRAEGDRRRLAGAAPRRPSYRKPGFLGEAAGFRAVSIFEWLAHRRGLKLPLSRRARRRDEKAVRRRGNARQCV